MESTPEDLDFGDIVAIVPSSAMPTTYSLDTVVMMNRETGEQKGKVVLSMITPQGVNKFWFDPMNLHKFAVQAMAEAKAAMSPKLQVAAAMPPEDDGQMAEAARQAAEEILRKR